MQDATLLKIAITTGLVGILLLFILSQTMEIAPSTLDQINKEKDGTYVAVNGNVQRVSVRGNATFVTMNASCTMTGVFFEQKNISLSRETPITMKGTLQTYKGEKEIIIDELEIT
jgi:DNA/RNA endonuclease YhcR with UshA esterase domain